MMLEVEYQAGGTHLRHVSSLWKNSTALGPQSEL